MKTAGCTPMREEPQRDRQRTPFRHVFDPGARLFCHRARGWRATGRPSRYKHLLYKITR